MKYSTGKSLKTKYIRIKSELNDRHKQITKQFVELINKHMSLSITVENIDITHRLGKFNGKNRQVIVNFFRRQVKNDIMQNVV